MTWEDKVTEAVVDAQLSGVPLQRFLEEILGCWLEKAQQRVNEDRKALDRPVTYEFKMIGT